MEHLMLVCLTKVYKFMFICEEVTRLPFESLSSSSSTFTIVSDADSQKSRHMVLHRGVL